MHDRSRDTVINPLEPYHVEDDINYVIEMCRMVVKPLGIWSLIYSRTTRREKVVSVIIRIMCISCLMSLIVILYCQILLGDIGGKAKIKWFGSALNSSLSALKYLYLFLNRGTFARCIKVMENDWRTVKNEQHRALMLKQAAFCRRLITWCVAFIFTGAFAFHIIVPFSKLRVVGNHTVKPLAYPGYDRFFDVESSPSYEFVFCIQCFAGFFRHNVTAASFTLAVFFVCHICGQIQVQMRKLEELNLGSKGRDADHNIVISEIIQNHNDILRYAKVIGESFSEIILIEIVAATFVTCIAEYCWILEWKDSETVAMTTYFVFMVSMTFNALFFNYIGQILTDQIGFASYEVDWYNLPATKARDFVLLGTISLFPPRLRGGKVTELSLNTFTIILKSSMVYLNFIRTVTFL